MRSLRLSTQECQHGSANQLPQLSTTFAQLPCSAGHVRSIFFVGIKKHPLFWSPPFFELGSTVLYGFLTLTGQLLLGCQIQTTGNIDRT